jgi:hypothetical protein
MAAMVHRLPLLVAGVMAALVVLLGASVHVRPSGGLAHPVLLSAGVMVLALVVLLSASARIAA